MTGCGRRPRRRRTTCSPASPSCRWCFDAVCATRGLEPEPTWHDLVRRHFKGTLKRPFNTEARDQAGLPPDFYEPLAAPMDER
ncbi:MAG: hypothetical protein JWO51_3864 [Rhodospirillales bacterium]|nr:hypothetical protein [Rhodospirillales bacterium]